MKFLLHILLILIGSYVLTLFVPWMGFIGVAFLVSYFMKQKEGQSFLAGFLAIALFWGVYAFILNQGNGGLLAGKIGEIFGGLSAFMMVLVTTIIGGLLGGLASWSGRLAYSLTKAKA